MTILKNLTAFLATDMKNCNSCGKATPLENIAANSAVCKQCKAEYNKEYRRKNKESLAEKKKEYYDNNKEKRQNSWYLREYGISLEDFNEMRENQQNRCAICDIHEIHAPKSILFVDHCHSSGKVRALLCHHCNSGLGLFKDNALFLNTAILYLEQHTD